jgi:hypothetical protein
VSAATITITGLPSAMPLAASARRRRIQELAQAFGRETIAAGFNVPGDMPSEEAFRAASATVDRLLADGTVDLALLVNWLAALANGESEATP